MSLHDPPSLLDELWPPEEPPRDFAERVLSACASRSDKTPTRTATLGQWLLMSAVAALFVAAPLFLLGAHPAASPPTAQATIEPDLGILHD